MFVEFAPFHDVELADTIVAAVPPETGRVTADPYVIPAVLPVLVVPMAEVNKIEPGVRAAVPVTVPAIAFTTYPLELTTLMWSVANAETPLVYFVSLSKFTVSAAGCVTVNESISDKVMFKLAVCANEAELTRVMNAISANIFFII